MDCMVLTLNYKTREWLCSSKQELLLSADVPYYNTQELIIIEICLMLSILILEILISITGCRFKIGISKIDVEVARTLTYFNT